MFVRVDVRNDNARSLNLAYLGRRFGGYLVGIHLAGNRASGKRHHAVTKVRSRGERGKPFRSQNRISIREDNMAANAELRNGFRQPDRLGKGRTIGHQRRRSYDAACMSLHNRPVHARSEAKIICVDDQTPHAASVAGHV